MYIYRKKSSSSDKRLILIFHVDTHIYGYFAVYIQLFGGCICATHEIFAEARRVE